MHVTQAQLEELAVEHLEMAKTAPHNRSAHAVLHDGRLRHTLVALDAGGEIDDHFKPEAATMQVMQGAVTVTWDGGETTIEHGGLYVLPGPTHKVSSAEPSVFLLTTIAD
jgi:quercetin dioxygenase-like cupin family protein